MGVHIRVGPRIDTCAVTDGQEWMRGAIRMDEVARVTVEGVSGIPRRLWHGDPTLILVVRGGTARCPVAPLRSRHATTQRWAHPCEGCEPSQDTVGELLLPPGLRPGGSASGVTDPRQADLMLQELQGEIINPDSTVWATFNLAALYAARQA